jgi:hypothetical protein
MRIFSQKDEQGITHLLLLGGAVIVLIVVFFAGRAVFGHTKPSASDGATTAYSRCLERYHDSRICQFDTHYMPVSKTAYQATVTVTSPQGTVSNLTYSSSGTGNSEVVGTSDGQKLSSIVLAGATYVKVSGSGWIEYPSGAVNAPAQTDPTASMNIAVSQSGLSFQYLDTENCGSLSCYKYQVTDKTQPDATQNIWFDTTSYKLRHWSYHGDTGSTDMTLTYEPVNITAPAPVKVIPAS